MNKGLSFLELMRNNQQSSLEALSAVGSTDQYSVNISPEDEVRPTLEGAEPIGFLGEIIQIVAQILGFLESGQMYVP